MVSRRVLTERLVEGGMIGIVVASSPNGFVRGLRSCEVRASRLFENEGLATTFPREAFADLREVYSVM
jgi:hypothetical protein